MNGDGTLNLAGGKHINGVRDSSGGHGDYTSPATHGPRFFDYLAGIGTQDCKLCHGATYDGGIGPSCNACHTTTGGWTNWQTNCSFCHGATTPAAKAGYSVAAHPTWSAPPDAIAQRLDPAHAPVPARTGAHQAHLTGLTAGGQSFAPAFSCATCHAVPADLAHIGGSTSRATVALAGAGQASLPAGLGDYAPATGTCTTYCHGSAPSPAWATTGVVCGSCHALPPAPASGHPNVPGNLTYCSVCHPDSVNANGTIKAGGKHLDGVRDSSGGHGDYTSPATHGPRFFDYQAGIGTLDCKALPRRHLRRRHRPVLQRLPHDDGRLDQLADQLLRSATAPRPRPRRPATAWPPTPPGRPRQTPSPSGSTRPTPWSRPAPAPTRPTSRESPAAVCSGRAPSPARPATPCRSTSPTSAAPPPAPS